MCAVHKRSAVEKWNLEAVKTWATQLAAARSSLMVCADTTMTHMRDVQGSWSGAAYTSAYDRVAGDHGQVQKLALEIDELVTAVNTSVDDVSSHRTNLLGKVAEAQGLGMTVDDVWKVMDYDNVEADVRRDHQQLINNALWPFEDSVSKAVQAITAQGTEIRSAGDLLGSSLDVSAADSQAGRFGKDDGAELAEAVRNNDKAKIADPCADAPARPHPVRDRPTGCGRRCQYTPAVDPGLLQDLLPVGWQRRHPRPQRTVARTRERG